MMKIFPAIDLRDQKVVRLTKGDYGKMTVYSESPLDIAADFKARGAKYLHVVDLDGAKDGTNPNFSVIERIVGESGLMVEVGGGIRSEDIIKKYIDAGVMRVILGTVAVTDPDFVGRMVEKYGEKIAVGVDLKDGMVATHGWTKVSDISCFDFCEKMEKLGVRTIICTDISKDGVLSGSNIELYRSLCEKFSLDIIASGGVSSVDELRELSGMNIYGAILGKALYNGNIKLEDALREGE